MDGWVGGLLEGLLLSWLAWAGGPRSALALYLLPWTVLPWVGMPMYASVLESELLEGEVGNSGGCSLLFFFAVMDL